MTADYKSSPTGRYIRKIVLYATVSYTYLISARKSVSCMLRDHDVLHCLPVQQRIDYKLCRRTTIFVWQCQELKTMINDFERGKMVNGSRYYRALESVSIASALSTALTINPCQIRVHQRWQSTLQLPTAWKKEWRPVTVGSSPQTVTCQHRDTHYISRPRTHNLPIVGQTCYQ